MTTHLEIQQVGANPTELRALRGDRPGEPLRVLFCPLYASCLDHAVLLDWNDWTCAKCALREQTPAPSAARYSRDRPKE